MRKHFIVAMVLATLGVSCATRDKAGAQTRENAIHSNYLKNAGWVFIFGVRRHVAALASR